MADEIDVKVNFDDTELITGLTSMQKGFTSVQTAAIKTAKEAEKAAVKIAKDAALASEKAAKAAADAIKFAEDEGTDAAKKVAKEAVKAAKAAERAAKKTANAAAKASRETLNVTSKASKEAAAAAKKAAQESEKAGKRISNTFKAGAGRILEFAGALGLAFSAFTLGEQVAKAGQLAIAYEQTTVAFETFLGSATAARSVLEELNQFSVATPFEPAQVIEAGQALLAFGFEADEVTTQLGRIGDISAGVNTDFNELSVIFGKARISGRLFAEDINQLTERGIPIIGELADQFGVAEKEVKKLVESGQVEFANLEKAFINLTSEGGKFFGLIDKQSQTVGGRISTLKGNFDGLLLALGQRLLPVIGNVVDGFNRLVLGAKNFVEVPLSEELDKQRISLNALVSQITTANLEEEDRLELINQLNQEYPTFLGNLDAEKVTTEQLSKRLKEVNQELINKIILQRKTEELQAAADKAAQAQLDLRDAEKAANIALVEGNQLLANSIGLENKTLEERARLITEKLKQDADVLVSNSGNVTGYNEEGEAIDNINKALEVVNEARNREAVTIEGVNELTKERKEIADEFDLTLDGLTKAEVAAAKAAREKADADAKAKLAAEQRAASRAKIEAAQKKADEDRKKLLAELERLTNKLAETAQDSLIEAETNQVKQSELLRDAQLAEIEQLRETIEEKAKEAGKEVDIDADIKALKEQVEREHQARISDILNEEFKKRTDDIAKQAEEDATSREARISGELAFLDKQRQIEEAKVELIDKSADETLSLEEFKQQQLLQAQLSFNQQSLRLFAERFGESSPEVELLKQQIEIIKKQLGEIGADDPKTLFGNLSGKLAKALGLDEDEFKTLVQGVSRLFDEVFNAVQSTTDAAIEQNDKLIASIEDRIDVTQQAFENEARLAEAGLANNVDLKRQELEMLNEERAKALAKQEELAAAERRIDTVQQTVSLITASANIYQSLSALGPIGVALATATIAAMFGAFIAAKAKAAQATTQLAEGGQIKGRSHSDGGHQIEGTNLEVEGNEWVVNKRDSMEHTNFLKRLNSGEFKGMNLNAVVDGKVTQGGNFGVILGDSQRDIEYSQEQARQAAQNKQISESIEQQTKDIVGAIDKKPVVIQTKDGYMLKRTINGKEYTRRVRM